MVSLLVDRIKEIDTRRVSYFFLAGAVLQFLFREAVFGILSIPLHANFLAYLGVLGTFGLFLTYLLSVVILVVMSLRAWSAIPLVLILAVSPFLVLGFPSYYSTGWWEGVSLLTIFLGLAIVLESMVKTRSLLNLLPSVPMVVLLFLVDDSSIRLYLHMPVLEVDYVWALAPSSVAVVAYTLYRGFKGVSLKRNIVSLLLGLISLGSVIPLVLLVGENRFMEMIMDMVVPTVLGVNLVNPAELPLFLFLYGLALFSVVVLLVQGFVGESAGIFAYFSTLFMGITGFHLLLYEVLPAMGISMVVLGNRSTTARGSEIREEESPPRESSF